MGSAPPKTIPVSLGTISMGRYDSNGVEAPFGTADKIKPLLDVFASHGHKTIDTARIYGYGGAEELLGECGASDRGLVVSTKLFPTKTIPLNPQNAAYSFNAADLKAGLQASLDALKTTKVETFFLYAPDSKTPLEETLAELTNLHSQGAFSRWGLSSFPPMLVDKVFELCESNGWVKPTVYQAIYNALIREPEDELIPCIRRHGMALEAAQPLASGLLTGRYRRDMEDSEHPVGGRFHPGHFIGAHLRQRYWHDHVFDALATIQAASEKHGLKVHESAIRWLCHHSALEPELGDRLIVGAGSAAQLDEVLADVEKGPLPAEVVEAIEGSWLKQKEATKS